MRFLKLRTDHKRVRRDGTRYVTPLIVDAPRRFAPSRDRKETSLRRKECQLITGAHDSGKSRWLMRLKDSRHEIWGKLNLQLKADLLADYLLDTQAYFLLMTLIS